MGKIIRPFACNIHTPQGQAKSAEMLSVVLPACDGMVGVLGGMAPLVMALGAGKLTLDETSGQHEVFFLSGGFAQMDNDVLTILAEEFCPLEELDPEEAWEALQQAEKLPADSPSQIARRSEALQAAQAKFRITQEFIHADD